MSLHTKSKEKKIILEKWVVAKRAQSNCVLFKRKIYYILIHG